MVRGTVVSRLKASRRPGLWVAVAQAGRVARAVSRRRRTRWSYRVGYALERAGRYDQAWQAYAAAAGPGGLPARPEPLDPVAVETARLLAVRRVRAAPAGRLFGDLWQRRGRIIPVVPRAQRRRWEQSAGDHAATLHLLYARHREHYLPRYFGRAQRYTMPRSRVARAWRWYVGDVAVQSWQLLRRNGRYVRRTAGVPVRRQLREMVWLSLRLPSMPENYYKYELYRPEHRAAADGYLHGHENSPVLYEALADTAGLLEAAPLTDKVAFAARAVEHRLAVVPTLAVLRDGEIAEVPGELPATDLFVKPLSGKGGRGVGKWRYYVDTDSFRSGGEAVPRARLLQVLADRSVGESHLVQPCLANHPDLADLALGAVVTCRLITITDETGRPEPVIATFRMPAVADAIVDNMHRGGIAAPVEIETGVLGAASDYAIAGPAVRHRRHPASDGAIEGRKLPLWDEVVALAIAAHERFHPRLLVGWDISIGPDGPILLEGNERPGVGGLQRLHNVALGRHRFGELLAHHLLQRLGDPREPAR
ncbi:hypothetical protein JQS43_02400 [Natronosporangium hydrolyticum]|uniref:Alpha-L-glutamate ligase-related protein ATP-grasp domain-containing protein n=1 Tax=Natronosporangium hydrolyticum TaxID=2811111 RepID=A0A895YKQ6_9ACTN|nr:sugar-transfer associated ATP-grasp domain-containing protein [Natronosporangium hydrolyticum]QSB15236.1 hypothetical protein JQS43_02400 [Natronosporangium hydrolyticum]